MSKEESDFKFLIRLLPNYYITCKDLGRREVWRCRSNTGIEDEERFDLLIKAFQQRWPGRYLEVNHTTCTNHVDFSIHLKSEFAPSSNT